MRSSSARVLVVDDHELMRETLIDILSMRGIEASGASNAADACAMIGTTEYDLVLLDLYLGEITGLEVLQDIRKAHPDLAVVMMSASPDEDARHHARQQGARAFLTKPMDPAELLRLIKEMREERQVGPDERQATGSS